MTTSVASREWGSDGRATSMAHTSGDSFSHRPDRLEDTNSSGEPGVIDLAKQLLTGRKLIVAANRGPLSFTREHGVSGSGQISARREANRIAGMFESLGDFPITWVSGSVDAADRAATETLAESGEIRSDELPDDWAVRFVTPPRRVHHRFYNVICNPLFWFLLHRSWSPTFTPAIGAQEHDAWNRGYVAVNRMFADEISSAARLPAGDAATTSKPMALVVRDYQLMLVPGMVRAEHPDAVIHYSFETPWPWPSDMEVLPNEWRTTILESLLSADVIAFPSHRDVRAFVACVSEFVGSQATAGASTKAGETAEFRNRSVQLEVSPPVARSEQFESVKDFNPTRRFIAEMDDGGVSHTFVTVDRAEPHKNIVRSINAYGDLLKQEPELAEASRYLLVLTPGPPHISAYRRISDEIKRAARRINEIHKGPGSAHPRVHVVVENNFYRAVAALSIYDTLVSVPVVDGLGRSALDGPTVNTKSGNMILSDTSAVFDLYESHVFRVGFADTDALRLAMKAAIVQSHEQRKLDADRLKAIAKSRPMERATHQLLSELLSVVR